MSIAGELNITLNTSDTHNTRCQISSSRPLQASHVFTGKTIDQTLTMIPLLFNICSKAQAVTVVRAIESAKQTLATPQIESTREALIALESLREQALRVAMDWPTFIRVAPESPLLSHIAMGISKIMKSLETSQSLKYLAFSSKVLSRKTQDITKGQSLEWKTFSETLSKGIFGSSTTTWLASDLDEWANQEQTQAASFIHWLSQKTWKNAGESTITQLPAIDDSALLSVLLAEQHQFTSQPIWKNQCHELSWFTHKQHNKQNLIAKNKALKGNGIFSRMVARLVEIANLMTVLDDFFIHHETLTAPKSSAKGLAHSHAARGRLSHYINVENNTVKKLLILAPTEWNFHPQGVTQDSLCRLQADNERDLRQQAELLIHAIDPCVGYKLNMVMN